MSHGSSLDTEQGSPADQLRGQGKVRRRDHRLAAFDPVASASSGVYFVVTTGDGTPHGYPKVLGLTSEPELSSFGYPDVRVVERDGGGFTFEKTSAKDSTEYSSVSVPGLREPFGVKEMWPGLASMEPELAERGGKSLKGKIPAKATYELVFVVSAEAAAGIRQIEQQHPDDFAQAFKITLEAVANEVNSLVGTRFETRVDALAALTKSLASQLRPPMVDNPESWTAHLKSLLKELMRLSTLRDPEPGSEKPRPGVTRIDHLPTKTVVFPKPTEGSTPMCEVRVDTPNVAATTPPAELVTLSRLESVAQATKVEQPRPEKPLFVVDDDLKFIVDVESPAFDPDSTYKGPLPKGTKCEAMTAPTYDKHRHAFVCKVTNHPDGELKFTAAVLCTELAKDDAEVTPATLPKMTTLPKVMWATGAVLFVRTKARYNTELVSKPTGTDGTAGVTSEWDGCKVVVKDTSRYTGVKKPELNDQEFYLVQIVKATATTASDENQYLLGVPGCALVED